MNLNSLAKLGRVETEKQITKGLKVKLRTLTALEYAKVMQMAKDFSGGLDTPSMEALGRLAELQMETLAHATVAVNDEEVPEADSDRIPKLRSFYQNLQYPVLTEVYRTYLDLLGTQNGVMDDLKKNLTTLPLETIT